MRRPYLAACELLEALTDDIRSEQEPMKEGAVSQVEVSGQYEPRETNSISAIPNGKSGQESDLGAGHERKHGNTLQ